MCSPAPCTFPLRAALREEPPAPSCTPGSEPCPCAVSSPSCSSDLSRAWERGAVPLQGWLQAGTRGALKISVFLMQQPQLQPWLQNFLKPSRSHRELPAAGTRKAASLLGGVQLTQMLRVEGAEGKERRESEKNRYKMVFYKPPIMHRHKP